MPDAAARVQRTYLVLTLVSTLAASFIWGVNTLFLLDAGLDNTGIRCGAAWCRFDHARRHACRRCRPAGGRSVLALESLVSERRPPGPARRRNEWC
jgi:hypothetical protein